MKMTTRELVLGWCTLAAIMLGLSFWLGEPMYDEWKETSVKESALEGRMQKATRLLELQPRIDERLQNLLKQLPMYPADQDVTSQLLKTLQRTADQHSLIILRQEPQKEEHVGDLYEVAITCSWEGPLDALVHFLYALQSQGAMVDLRQLTITPSRSGGGRLKGNFIADFAYSRESKT